MSNLLQGNLQPKKAKLTTTVSRNPENEDDDDFVLTPGPLKIESKDPEICAIMDKKVCDCTAEDLLKVWPFMEKLQKCRESLNVNVHIHYD